MRLTFWLLSFLTQSKPSLQHSSAARRRSRRRVGRTIPQYIARAPEQLEDRTLLTSAISFLDGTLTIDVGADGEQTTLSVSAGELSVTSTDTGGTTADANAQALGFATMTSADVASTGSLNGGSPVTQIVINGAVGTQTIVLDDGAFPALTAGGSSDIELITVTGDVTLGNNDLQLLAMRTVALHSGSSIATVDGNVTLSANEASTSNVDSTGVLLDAATISTSGSGNIVLTGRGGSGTGDANRGVAIESGSVVESAAGDSSAGTILINGTGGSGTQFNHGVVVSANNASVTSAAGAISIFGTGGQGSGGRHHGVLLSANASITSTGAGMDAATIEVSGFGGLGGSDNRGVELFRAGAVIASVDGDVTIAGQGGGDSNNTHIGVALFQGASIASTGTGPNAAEISIAGTGGTGTSFSRGIAITGDSSVDSIDGDIQIDGTGGTGTGDANSGVLISGGGRVVSTGVSADAASVTISGTGGAAHRQSRGVAITSENSRVSSVDGDITISGTGGNGTGNNNQGVVLLSDAMVSSLGTSSNAAVVAIVGSGGTGSREITGVLINRAEVQSQSGDIFVTGTGGTGTSNRNDGIAVVAEGRVASYGTDGETASISMTGIGGSGFSENTGIRLEDDRTSISTAMGAITLQGTGGNGTENFNIGISARGGAKVESTASGDSTGTVTLNGVGGAGESTQRGIFISDTGTGVYSVDADIQLEGQGGSGTLRYSDGFRMQTRARIEATGAGAITINGTGGRGIDDTLGIDITGPRATVASNAGNILISGTGGGNRGQLAVNLGTFAFIESSDGDIQLDARSAAGSYGIIDVLADAAISTQNGRVEILADHDIHLAQLARIESGSDIALSMGQSNTGSFRQTSIQGDLTASTSILIGGGGGNDAIEISSSSVSGTLSVTSGLGDDVIDSSGLQTSITIDGESGDDSLTGSAFDDVLNGEDGDDTLVGLGGLDRLTGGSGVDSFENVARPLIVDTAADVDDGDYSAGNLSLREAVRLANESVDLDETISFDTALNGMTIALTGGELPVINPVIINGPGAELLTIDAGGLSRVFNVDDTTGTSIAVSFSGLTLNRGMTTGNGGAIVNREDLTVNDLTVTGSSAMYGGGIYNDGVLSVTGSTLSGNSAESGGGILDEQATLTVTTSTIADNTATFQGAGIRLGRSTATITDSAILRNTGAGEGGGIGSYQSNLVVTNSTLFGNESRGDGGAIFVGSGGAAIVTQSTVSGNRSGVQNEGLVLSTPAQAATLELNTFAIKNEVSVNADGSGSITFTDRRGTPFQGTDATIGDGSLFIQFVESSTNSPTGIESITIAPNGDVTIAIELEDGTSGDGDSSFSEIQAAIVTNAAAASRISVADNSSAGGFTAAAAQRLTGGVDGETIMFVDRRATTTDGAFATLGGALSLDLDSGVGNSAATSATASTDVDGDITVTVTLGTDGSGQINATVADVVDAIRADQTAGGAAEFLLITGDTNGSTLVRDSGGTQLLAGGHDGLNNDVLFTDERSDPSAGTVRINFENAGADQAVSVVVSSSSDDHDITVTLSTDSDGNVTSTAAEVAAAINADPFASSLVRAVASGDGSEVVADSGGLANGLFRPRTDFIFGGGIRKRSGSLTIHNSIIAGNFRGVGSLADDVTGIVDFGTFNLIGDADSSGGLMDGVDGNIVGDQGVGVLDLTGVIDPAPRDNGGLTHTLAIPEGSIAIDAGDNARVPALHDQRVEGFDRILDGDGDLTATVDIGSFEYTPSAPAAVMIDVPASLELLVQDGLLILRDIEGTEYFRRLESSVSQLRIDLSDGPDLLRVLNVDSPVVAPLRVYAGGGNDQVDAMLTLAQVNLFGGSGDDTLTGGAFADVLNGGAGADSLHGSTGHDLLRGQGGSGDVLVTSPSNDTLDGGAGIDRILQHPASSVQLRENTIYAIGDEGAGFSQLVSIEAAVLNGTDRNELLTAEHFSGPVTINGGGGSDRIYGGAADDVLDGGEGDDLIVGFGGDDRLSGGSGDDNLVGGAGSDTLTGGDGDDRLRGLGSSGDVLSGGPGADRLDGGKGNDRLIDASEAGFILTDISLDDGTSVDTLVGLESAFLTGGDGGHRLDASGFSGWVRMTGGQGNDTLIGTALGDALNGRGGNDRIEGQDGHDRIRGASGRDLLIGGNGNDLLLGQGSSGDTLRGGDGTDTLDGGAGTDRIFDDGIDTIFADPLDNIVLL